ncbi:DinB family protein [bacterium]|nr:DinB family protein [bacterium]
MLDYFTRLFEYNHWANSQLIERLGSLAEAPPKTLDRLTHIVQVEFLWRARAEGKVFAEDVFAAKQLDEIARLNEGSHRLWLAFLDSLTVEQLLEVKSYSTLSGDPKKSVLSDILAHVVNHGTHHRGQIVASIREAGSAPPALDFIYFARESS